MILVNLLPEAYRKPKVAPIQQFHRSPLALLFGAALLSSLILLGLLFQMHQAHLAGLTSRLRQLEPRKAAVDQLQTSIRALQNQQDVFARLMRERSRWARYLNTLSDAVPNGVWFTDLSFDPLKGLVIQGSAINQGGEEMVRIGRFVQDLKSDTAFAVTFQDIQIESIKSVQDQEMELVEFTLTADLIDAAASAPLK